MRIFYDVDTQNDFMNRDGALYVPDAELLKPNLRRLTEYAEANRIAVVGSLDWHFGTPEYKEREPELQVNGGPFPNHCMINTKGAEKIDETRLSGKYPEKGGKWPAQLYIGHPINTNRIAEEEIREALRDISEMSHYSTQDGVYFVKQSYDVFTNPALEVFLSMAGVKEAVVYGVATDFCVKAAVLGMQKRGVQCFVVEDAIKGVFPDKSKEALEEMAAAGARLVTTKQVLEARI